MTTTLIFVPRDLQATVEEWGYIPGFLSDEDPRTVREQFNAHYQSGWRPFKGHTKDNLDGLHYPGDPVLRPLSELMFRDERILLYPCQLVCVIQPDGSWEVARMD